jgi:hypothetical protein
MTHIDRKIICLGKVIFKLAIANLSNSDGLLLESYNLSIIGK